MGIKHQWRKWAKFLSFPYKKTQRIFEEVPYFTVGAGETLRVLAVLARDPGLIPSMTQGLTTICTSSSRGPYDFI